MKLKDFLAALVYVTSTIGFASQDARPAAERPPRYEPRPERPAPTPRPTPRPEPRPERPAPRPERPERPPVRPPERPERPPTRPPEHRPPVRPPENRPPVRPPDRPERPPTPRPPSPPVRPPDYNPYPPPYPAPTPRPPYEEQVMVYVARTFYNYDRLQLDHYINMYNYRGYRLNSIEVSLDTYASGGQFSLALNGLIDRTHYLYHGWQNFVMYPSRYVQLGYNAWDISFLIRGTDQVYVRHLILRMSR